MATFTLPTARQIIQTGSESAQWVPMTGWLPAISIASCRTLLELTDRAGNIGIRVGYQVATLTTKLPGDWSDVGTERTSDDRFVEDLTLVTAVHMYVRFGVSCRLSAAGYGQAQVTLSVTGSDQ